jgi:hypothetical protein
VARVRFTPREAGVFHGALVVDGVPDAVPVRAVGYRGLLAFPAELTLGPVRAGGAPTTVAIKAVGAAPVEITRVELPAGVAGELQTATPGREFRLVLRVRGGRLDGGEGAVRLHTTDPGEPLLTIPVRSGA